jgi:hypothetical protein
MVCQYQTFLAHLLFLYKEDKEDINVRKSATNQITRFTPI